MNYLGKPCTVTVWSVTGIDDDTEVCHQISQSANDSMSHDRIFDQSGSQRYLNVGMDTSRTTDDRTQSCKSNNNSSDLNSSRTESETRQGTSNALATSTPKRTKQDNEIVDRLSTSLHNLKVSDSPCNNSGSTSEKASFQHPKTIFKLTLNTELVLVKNLDSNGVQDTDSLKKSDAVTYDMIGGLQRQLKTIRETLEVPLTNPDLFVSLGR